MSDQVLETIEGLIIDIDTFAIHDGPGIRMTVYLKGCPLSCAWCHSPESQGFGPELAFAVDRCVRCGACVLVCERGAQKLDEEGQRSIDRERCVVCGQCAERCLPGALTVKGHKVTAASLIEKAIRLKSMFEFSGGGITLTGGEVTMQAEFAAVVLAACRAQGIHTAIETCGASSWADLKLVADQADLILYDLKLMDDEAHRRWTGASNRRILENVAKLVGRNVQIRVPLIPDITDTESNLRSTFEFMQRVGLSSVALLPYNPSAGAKYEWLDMWYGIEGAPQSTQQLEQMVEWAHEYGVQAVID